MKSCEMCNFLKLWVTFSNLIQDIKYNYYSLFWDYFCKVFNKETEAMFDGIRMYQKLCASFYQLLMNNMKRTMALAFFKCSYNIQKRAITILRLN